LSLKRYNLLKLKVLFIVLGIVLSGCVAANRPPPPPETEIWDPVEPVNRGVFAFNTTLDEYVLEPVARGYDWALPEFAQQRVRNVFDTLAYPKYFVNDLLQLKVGQATEHTGRFLLNLTFGIAGIFDVATDVGLPRHVEDFGTTLGYHGVAPGPYVMLPFLGPSNIRDVVGRVADGFLDPINLLFYTNTFNNNDTTIINASGQALYVLQTRADLIEAIETGKESSVDYYLFAQAAYYQYRLGLIYEGERVASDEEFGDESFGDDDEFGSSEEESLSSLNSETE
jgi:phospholipid-binding lipoprotein MlaA